MVKALRPFVAVVFALVIVVTSGAMAVARGQPPAAGDMVICTGQGIVTVTVDAEGNPTGPAHICPDCALGFFHATFDAPATERAAPLILVPGLSSDSPVLSGRSTATVRARGPPLS